MYAVIETGGKQYRATPGETIDVEKLAGEVGAAVEFDKVLAVIREPDQTLGGAALSHAKVKGIITAHGRGNKILVFKFRRKKQYKRTIGHRQDYTRVKVEEIIA
jgi:large subunit ribosomal protein L21